MWIREMPGYSWPSTKGQRTACENSRGEESYQQIQANEEDRWHEAKARQGDSKYCLASRQETQALDAQVDQGWCQDGHLQGHYCAGESRSPEEHCFNDGTRQSQGKEEREVAYCQRNGKSQGRCSWPTRKDDYRKSQLIPSKDDPTQATVCGDQETNCRSSSQGLEKSSAEGTC